jgi:chorismate mutase
MESIRNQIDTIDHRILQLLAERMVLSRQIGVQKQDRNLPIQDPAREAEMLDTLSGAARKTGLEPSFIRKLYEVILEESRRVQKNPAT